MRSFLKTQQRRLAMLLVVALAFGPIGCGCECAAPELLEIVGFTGLVLGTANELQKVEATRLETEVNRLRLKRLQEAWADDDGDDEFRITRRPRPSRYGERASGGQHVPGLN